MVKKAHYRIEYECLLTRGICQRFYQSLAKTYATWTNTHL